IGIALVILILVSIVAMRPSDFRYARSATIATPPGVVFGHVNDFKKMDVWSPWLKFDPNVKITHEGPPSGVGAIESWDGNKNVGAGRMTVTDSRPNELIRLKLEFFRPFAATNTAEFTFQPQGNGTTVTWAMMGKYNFMTKAMGLVMNMDKMIGGNFEKGLAELKTIAESEARK
ncbi:MAG TPA: SRPBCC family protein, partial [Tepidisphaeraceae bacterium]|nr:SRPBCC family protein [Tepidisphaeraceae bacterium]